MPTDLGTAVAKNVKASVVKRVVETYAACAVNLADVVKKREDRGQAGDGATEVDALQKGAAVLQARAVAALAASKQDVLAAKWLPP